MNMDEKQRIDLRVSDAEPVADPAATKDSVVPPPSSAHNADAAKPAASDTPGVDQPSSYREFRKKQKEKSRGAGDDKRRRLFRLVTFGGSLIVAMLLMLGWWFMSAVDRYRAQQVPAAPPVVAAQSPAQAGQKYLDMVHLQPDKSFELALQDLESLTGQAITPPKIASDASFLDKWKALQTFAKECVAKAGIQKGAAFAPSPSDSYAMTALLDDLSSLDKQLGKGTISGALAARAARDIARLSAIAPDYIGGNEPVVGRALALAAIADATGQNVNETVAMIATDAHSFIDAKKLAASFPLSHPLRLSSVGNVAGLKELVQKQPSNAEAQFIYAHWLSSLNEPLESKYLTSIPAGDPTRTFLHNSPLGGFWHRVAMDQLALAQINDLLEHHGRQSGEAAIANINPDSARSLAEPRIRNDYNEKQIARLQKNLANAPDGALFGKKLYNAYFNSYFFGLIFDVADMMEFNYGSYDKLHQLHDSLGPENKLNAPAAELAQLLDLRGWSRPVAQYESMLKSPTNFGNGIRESVFNHLRSVDGTHTHTRYGFGLLMGALDASPLGYAAAARAAKSVGDPYAERVLRNGYYKNLPAAAIEAEDKAAVEQQDALPPRQKPVKATAAKIAEAAKQAESWREQDLLDYGDILRDNGKLDEAYKVYERSYGRYNDDYSLSRMMGVMWRQNKPEAAADFFMNHINDISADWSYNYGPEFADVFADNPEGGQKAFDWMVARRGMFWSYFEGIAKNFAARGDLQNAFKYQSQLTSATPMYEARNRLIAYDYLRRLKGEPEARKWLQETIAKSPKLADGTQFAVPALTTKILEPLWTVLPPNPTDPKSAIIWEARAAAEAADPGLADRTGNHLKDLKDWAENADSPIAKFHLKMLPQSDILEAKVSDPVQLRLYAQALGWKAEAAGDVLEAAKWYAVAANVGPQDIPDFLDLPVQRMKALRSKVQTARDYSAR